MSPDDAESSILNAPNLTEDEFKSIRSFKDVDAEIEKIHRSMKSHVELTMEQVNNLVRLYNQRRVLALEELAKNKEEPTSIDIEFGCTVPYYEAVSEKKAIDISGRNPFGIEMKEGDLLGSMHFMPFGASERVVGKENIVIYLWLLDLLAFIQAMKDGLLPAPKLLRSITNATNAKFRVKHFKFVATKYGRVLSARDIKIDDHFVEVWCRPADLIEMEEEIQAMADKITDKISRDYDLE